MRKKLAISSVPLLMAGLGTCGSDSEDYSATDSSGRSTASAADDSADNSEENTSDEASEHETASADTWEWMTAFEAVFDHDAEAFCDMMEESVDNKTAILSDRASFTAPPYRPNSSTSLVGMTSLQATRRSGTTWNSGSLTTRTTWSGNTGTPNAAGHLKTSS